MNKFFKNKHQIFLNEVKVRTIMFLFLILSFFFGVIIIKKFELNIFLIIIFIFLALFLIFKIEVLGLKIINSFFDTNIKKDEETLTCLEKIASKASIKTPILKIINTNLPICFSMGFKEESYYVFISKKLVDNLDFAGKCFLATWQIHFISNNTTRFLSYLTLLWSSPLLLTDLLFYYLIKNRFNFIFKILSPILYLFLSPIIFLLYKLLLSKNRIYTADFCSSKIINTTNSFVETLSVFLESPSFQNEYIPIVLSPMLFAKGNYLNIYKKVFSLQPTVRDRIVYIKSLIG